MSDEENNIMEDDKIMKGGAVGVVPVAAPIVIPLAVNPNPPKDTGILRGDPPDNELNENLLQIINDGIDKIVYQLKLRLGNNNDEINRNTYDIKDLLDNLGTYIENKVGNPANAVDPNLLLTDGASNISLPNFIKNPDTNLYDVPVNNAYYGNKLYGDNIILVNDLSNIIPNNLDENYIAATDSDDTFDRPIDVADPNNDADRTLVENRLKNCQNLEFLYLKKHEEIMKIFAFTINLFDKYKYSVKVMLYLLKHLVYKDQRGHIAKGIHLPKTIIPNIRKLLKDQETIQGVIDTMEKVIVKGEDPGNNADGSPKVFGATQQNVDSLKNATQHIHESNDPNAEPTNDQTILDSNLIIQGPERPVKNPQHLADQRARQQLEDARVAARAAARAARQPPLPGAGAGVPGAPP